jgi:hypothetical protein
MSKKNRQDQAPAAAAPQGSRLADYFWANVLFFAFLFILATVVRQSCESPTDDAPVKRVLDDAFHYLLLLFGGGFLLVTLFDAAYEFFAARSGEDGPGDPSQAG